MEIQRRSYDSSVDVNDLIGFAEKEILEITEGHVKRSVQKSSDILRRTIAEIEKAGKSDTKYSGVCSGFKDLDNILIGFRRHHCLLGQKILLLMRGYGSIAAVHPGIATAKHHNRKDQSP